MYDIVIIGAGPSGLTALLYATGYGLDVVCLGDAVGGKLLHAPDIIDYPGIENISGDDFIAALTKQVSRAQGKVEQKMIDQITHDKTQNTFAIMCSDNSTITAKTIIIATGNGNKQKENAAIKLCGQLAINTLSGRVVVGENGMTSVSGVFAAGDCISYPHALEQLSNAVATGISAAAGAYEYIKEEKPPILWGSSKIPRR